MFWEEYPKKSLHFGALHDKMLGQKNIANVFSFLAI